MWLFLLIHCALLALPAEIWLARYIARKRRAGLPIFDYRSTAARLARMPFPKWPNGREVLMAATVGAAIWATLFWNHVAP
jgi:hypothetical protein